MFRQVAVVEEDWDLQRIQWRSDPREVLRTYQLVTVTYGTTPASFMSTQCLVTLAQQNADRFPRASEVILKDFYMDDLMSGVETEDECIQLGQEVTNILDSAKLPLRKWCSNSSIVLENIGKDTRDPLFTLEIGDEEMVKSLGLCWKPVSDEFRFNVTPIPARSRLTKRTLLSDLNKVFDPLGFISPVLLKGKIFLQQIWAMKMDWDSNLSSDIQGRWKSFSIDLDQLQNISIPRKTIPEKVDEIQIHGFSDASQEAYGACLYVRSRGINGHWHSKLLCSKTRVAPLKGSTIPRLELCGALLLAELANKVADSWSLEVKEFRFWTDSTIVLGWLNSQGNRLITYFSNRVSHILDISNVNQWHHVATEDNPADLASRGVKACDLITATIWWNGPSWLVEEEYVQLQNSCPILEESVLPEQRIIRLALVGTLISNNLIQHYSDWNRLKNGVAWIMRFINYLHDKNSVSRLPYHCLSELRQSELCILKMVQAEVFQDELQVLKNDRQLPTRSKIKCLFPYLKDGLILVGGRLQNAETLETRKHPIVLPASHKVTQLIFRHNHISQLHCGPQSLLATVRRQYWPLRGRVMARSVVLKCVVCTRAKPRFTEPTIAVLPSQRVQSAFPFTNTGVDFAGPIIIRSGIRKVTNIKAWIAIFVCLGTRAIHLEALRQFISRRGRCATILSDNGTNFVGAQRELASY